MRANVERRLSRAGYCGIIAAAALLAACGGGSGGGDGGNGGGEPPPPPPPPTLTIPTATSSSQTSYVTPTATGWQAVPLLTVGDTSSASSYALVGKPDGLGAMAGRLDSNGQWVDTNGYLTVFVDHELPSTRGAAHAHGMKGAFVSQWTFALDTLRATEGRDLATRVFRYGSGAWSDATGTLAFDRLCSADLPPASALYNAATGRGYDGRLFLNGEEVPEGRGFAFAVDGPNRGEAYELPYLGKYSHENVLVNPSGGDTTLAISTDDDNPGQVYLYVGTKSSTGNPVERAGLHGGTLYGIRVTDGGANYGSGPVARENAGAINGRFALVDVTDAALGTGANLQAVSVTRGVTEFARPEDAAWDTTNSRAFYVNVTGMTIATGSQTARLYRLVLDAVDHPTGGTIELVVDSGNVTGSDGERARGFDNVAVDGGGRVLVQEDGGDDAYVSKAWLYDPNGTGAVQLLQADRTRFVSGGANFLTVAEEMSGVIEITDQLRGAPWYDAGRRYYLGTLQAHYPLAEALFEGGQLYLFAAPK